MKKPLVSFVIRTKNEAKFIGKVLKYVFKQTYKNIEVVVVDSGSTDRTLQIVSQYPVRVLKISPSKFNYSRALNFGISKSGGEFIVIISGHSVPISDDWLECGLRHFKSRQVGAVTGTYSEWPLGYFIRVLGKKDPTFKGKVVHKCKWMTNTNAIIRRDCWQKYKFDENLKDGCEDYDWACEMLARGYDVVKDPGFGVFHSHYLLGRPGYMFMHRKWKSVVKGIDKKRRKPQAGV